MYLDFFLCTSITALLLVITFISRYTTGSFLYPATFYCLVWSVFLTIHLVFAPDIRPCASGCAWIVFSAILFALGAGGAEVVRTRIRWGVNHTPAVEHRPEAISNFRLRLAIYASMALGFGYSAATIVTSGFSLNALFSTGDLSRTASDLSADRYSANPMQTIFWVQLTLIGVYAAPIWGGVLAGTKSTGLARAKSLLTLTPALAVCITQTTRASIMFALLLWVAGYIAQSLLRGESNVRLFSVKEFFLIGLATGVLVLIYAIGDVLRHGEVPSLENIDNFLNSTRIRGSLFGSLHALSSWLQDGSNPQLYHPTIGAYTFGGVFEFLGLRTRESGLYGEDTIEVIPGIHTNIFTVHRGLIQDLSIFGASAFMLIMGAFVTLAYRRAKDHNRKYVPLMITFYAFTSSCLTSILTYNSMLVALVLTGAYPLFYRKSSFNSFDANENRLLDFHPPPRNLASEPAPERVP